MASTVGKVIKCKAAIMRAVNEPLTIEDIEVAPPKANEIRVKMVATGLCHSDLNVMMGNVPVKLPMILGHEGAGIVESVGPGVTKVKAGDHVVPLFVAQCNDCKFCHNPKTNSCIKAQEIAALEGALLDGTTRFTCKGKPIYHMSGVSSFSEYGVCPDVSVVKVNPKAPLEKMCLIGCGIPTGYGSVVNIAKVEKGSTCAVWGLGGIGLATVMGCRIAGAKRIIGVDTNESKFELAKQFGCTEFINPKTLSKPIQEHIKEITDGGLDYSFECCGTTRTIRDAMESTCKDYGVAVINGIAPFGQEVKFEPFDIIYGRTWKGALYGGWKCSHIPMLVEMYLNKELMVDEFITHTMGLDKINEGFDLMKQGKSIRSTVVHKK